MTINQLIKILSTLPGDQEIYIYRDGVFPISQVSMDGDSITIEANEDDEQYFTGL